MKKPLFPLSPFDSLSGRWALDPLGRHRKSLSSRSKIFIKQ